MPTRTLRFWLDEVRSFVKLLALGCIAHVLPVGNIQLRALSQNTASTAGGDSMHVIGMLKLSINETEPTQTAYS